MGGIFFAYVNPTIPEPRLKPLSFLQRIAFVLLSNIVDSICLSLSLGSLCCSIDQCDYPFANITLS